MAVLVSVTLSGTRGKRVKKETASGCEFKMWRSWLESGGLLICMRLWLLVFLLWLIDPTKRSIGKKSHYNCSQLKDWVKLEKQKCSNGRKIRKNNTLERLAVRCILLMILKLHALLLLYLLTKVGKVGGSRLSYVIVPVSWANSTSKSDSCQHKPWKVKSLVRWMCLLLPSVC